MSSKNARGHLYRRAMSLIELLVVIAIIGILIAIRLPAARFMVVNRAVSVLPCWVTTWAMTELRTKGED